MLTAVKQRELSASHKGEVKKLTRCPVTSEMKALKMAKLRQAPGGGAATQRVSSSEIISSKFGPREAQRLKHGGETREI